MSIYLSKTEPDVKIVDELPSWATVACLVVRPTAHMQAHARDRMKQTLWHMGILDVDKNAVYDFGGDTYDVTKIRTRSWSFQTWKGKYNGPCFVHRVFDVSHQKSAIFEGKRLAESEHGLYEKHVICSSGNFSYKRYYSIYSWNCQHFALTLFGLDSNVWGGQAMFLNELRARHYQ